MREYKRYHLRGILLGIFVFIILPFVGCSAYFTNMWKGAIPEGVDLGRTLARSTDFMGSPGGSCRGAVFRFKKSTVSVVENEGLNFFLKQTSPIKWKGSAINWENVGE